ncbi:unnamed protein product [Arabis nemorensis]|uniref:Uncharacterized protein n=1 Tax=Arabis nemorensis TaxID=586526 RepID=A0A565CRP5_9BRAS|nr:unnamed protein product [Arabis nemorensis]
MSENGNRLNGGYHLLRRENPPSKAKVMGGTVRRRCRIMFGTAIGEDEIGGRRVREKEKKSQ